MNTSCLVRLVSLLATVGICYYLKENFLLVPLKEPWNHLVPIIAGSSLWSSFAIFRYTVRKFQEVKLLRKVQEFGKWKDGERIAVEGSLQAFGDLLKSPFSNHDCIAYKYKVTHPSKHDSEKKRIDVVDYEGYGLSRAYIQTAMGNVRLLGFPMDMTQVKSVWPKSSLPKGVNEFTGELKTDDMEITTSSPESMEEIFEDTPQEVEMRNQTLKYIQSVDFEKRPQSILAVGAIHDEVDRTLLMSDGFVKKDFGGEKESNLSLEDSSIEENFLPRGEHVCLIGKWSEEKKGILSEGEGIFRKLTVVPGGSEKTAAETKKFAIQCIPYAIFFLLVPFFLVWLVLKYPSLFE